MSRSSAHNDVRSDYYLTKNGKTIRSPSYGKISHSIHSSESDNNPYNHFINGRFSRDIRSAENDSQHRQFSKNYYNHNTISTKRTNSLMKNRLYNRVFSTNTFSNSSDGENHIVNEQQRTLNHSSSKQRKFFQFAENHSSCPENVDFQDSKIHK